MRGLKMNLIVIFVVILMGCYPQSGDVQSSTVDHEVDDEAFWRYQLAKMDEVVLMPSKAEQVRVIITIPYGGETIVIRSTFMGDNYQVVKKIASGGVNDVSYDAKAIGYDSSMYKSNWKAAKNLLQIANFDTVMDHTLNDLAIASIETVTEHSMTSITFPYCGKNAEIVGRIIDKLLIKRELEVGSFSCPTQ